MPKAVNLIQELFYLQDTRISGTQALVARTRNVKFIVDVLGFFFIIIVTKSLSEQIRDLSAYSHLITARYRYLYNITIQP